MFSFLVIVDGDWNSIFRGAFKIISFQYFYFNAHVANSAHKGSLQLKGFETIAASYYFLKLFNQFDKLILDF